MFYCFIPLSLDFLLLYLLLLHLQFLLLARAYHRPANLQSASSSSSDRGSSTGGNSPWYCIAGMCSFAARQQHHQQLITRRQNSTTATAASNHNHRSYITGRCALCAGVALNLDDEYYGSMPVTLILHHLHAAVVGQQTYNSPKMARLLLSTSLSCLILRYPIGKQPQSRTICLLIHHKLTESLILG